MALHITFFKGRWGVVQVGSFLKEEVHGGSFSREEVQGGPFQGVGVQARFFSRGRSRVSFSKGAFKVVLFKGSVQGSPF